MGENPARDGAASAAREAPLVDAAWNQVAAILSPPGASGTGHKGPAGHAMPHGGIGPDAFPGYRVLGELQRGGQGVVYLAFQESTRRKVAIKVLRQGPFAGAAHVARFEREVDLLTRLRHPGIVAVHDRGVASGHPFLVMDYVAGKPLDAYVSASGLDARGSLELFRKICEAVHAAHLVGIIHRDLKPANICVDEAGEPRVLDFGLAKLADGSGSTPTAAADLTEAGQFIGSLPWASPEQAEGRHDRTDLRTDVYSLGVLLFQMLTGELPYPRDLGARELAACIAGAEPVRPSSVRRDLGGDVETIILKCLAKDPERRYQSAGDLARDVGNALAGRPIDAKRDSSWYVLRKNLRRHWVSTAVAGAFVLLLVGTAATTTVLYRRAQERQHRAEREALKAAKIGQILGSLLTSLSPWDWAGANNARVLAAMLDQASARAAAELADEPEVRAALDEVLGIGYCALDDLPRAEEHLERSLLLRRSILGEQHADVAAAQAQLGLLRLSQSRIADAESLGSAALEWQLANLGEEHADTVETLALLAGTLLENGDFDEAETFARRALGAARAVYNEDHPRLIEIYHTLGVLMQQGGRLDEAATVVGEALRIGLASLPADHPVLATTRTQLGTLCNARQLFDEGEAHLREALRIRRATFDGPHRQTAITLNNLATLLAQRGSFEEAEPLAREALAMHRGLSPIDTGHTAASLLNLGGALKGQGKLDEASAAYEEALSITRGQIGHSAATALNNIGMLRKARGDLLGAEAADREALEIRRGLYGSGHIDVAHSLNNLGDTLLKRGDAAGAEPLFREAIGIYREQLGDGNPLGANTLGHLGRSLLAQHPGGAEAAVAFEQSLEVLAENDPPASRRVVRNRCDLAEALIREGRHEEAETQLRACEAALSDAPSPHPEASRLAQQFVRLYEAWQKPEAAQPWRERIQPDGER